jgi:hypothetical protein
MYPSFRRSRVKRVDLDSAVDQYRMIAENMLLGINESDPGYDDLPATLSELPSWPAWGNNVIDEATAFAKLGHMSDWTCEQIENATLYSIQKNLRRKVSRDDPSISGVSTKTPSTPRWRRHTGLLTASRRLSPFRRRP